MNGCSLSEYWENFFANQQNYFWQDWQVFNRHYVVFRFALYSVLNQTQVSLKEFFTGAKMNVPNISIVIPSELQVEDISERFPSNLDGILKNNHEPDFPPFDIGKSVLNASGAPFDSFMFVKTTNGKDLLLIFQMKLGDPKAKKPRILNDSIVLNEYNKIYNSLRPQNLNLNPGTAAEMKLRKKLSKTEFVCVVLGRCGGEMTEKNLPKNCVVLTQNEQLNFYGPPYYQRLYCSEGIE
jgi:hypothetical protein